jgi:hypothetical protein
MLTRSESNGAVSLNKPSLRMNCRIKSGNTTSKIVLATRFRARALFTTTTPSQKIDSPPANKGRRSAERRMPTMSAQQRQMLPSADAFSAAARHYRGRARLPALPPRHSPPAITPMAQPQNRVSSRHGAQGVLPARRITP